VPAQLRQTGTHDVAEQRVRGTHHPVVAGAVDDDLARGLEPLQRGPIDHLVEHPEPDRLAHRDQLESGARRLVEGAETRPYQLCQPG
jgi:hypothetical protein